MITGSKVTAEDVWVTHQAEKEIAYLKMRLELVEYNSMRFMEICEKHMKTIAQLKKEKEMGLKMRLELEEHNHICSIIDQESYEGIRDQDGWETLEMTVRADFPSLADKILATLSDSEVEVETAARKKRIDTKIAVIAELQRLIDKLREEVIKEL